MPKIVVSLQFCMHRQKESFLLAGGLFTKSVVWNRNTTETIRRVISPNIIEYCSKNNCLVLLYTFSDQEIKGNCLFCIFLATQLAH